MTEEVEPGSVESTGMAGVRGPPSIAVEDYGERWIPRKRLPTPRQPSGPQEGQSSALSYGEGREVALRCWSPKGLGDLRGLKPTATIGSHDVAD